MIITREGKVIQMFTSEMGIIIHHEAYNTKFAICLEFDDIQAAQSYRMRTIKHLLSTSDYKAIKYAEGELSEEEYAPIREERQALRDEYNRIEEEYVKPSITPEEMDLAERTALGIVGE